MITSQFTTKLLLESKSKFESNVKIALVYVALRDVVRYLEATHQSPVSTSPPDALVSPPQEEVQ